MGMRAVLLAPLCFTPLALSRGLVVSVDMVLLSVECVVFRLPENGFGFIVGGLAAVNALSGSLKTESGDYNPFRIIRCASVLDRRLSQ